MGKAINAANRNRIVLSIEELKMKKSAAKYQLLANWILFRKISPFFSQTPCSPNLVGLKPVFPNTHFYQNRDLQMRQRMGHLFLYQRFDTFQLRTVHIEYQFIVNL